MNRTDSDSPQDFSARQGQYLAFIHAYTFVNGRPPAQSDIARFFRVTPPTERRERMSIALFSN